MDSQNYVSSKALIALQDALKKLSEELKDTYELLKENEKKVGETWQDDKFEEFEEEFSRSRELIDELSEKYNGWANKYLPPYIKEAIEYEETLVSLGK